MNEVHNSSLMICFYPPRFNLWFHLDSRGKQAFDALRFKLFPWSHLGELSYWKESILEGLLICFSLSNAAVITLYLCIKLLFISLPVLRLLVQLQWGALKVSFITNSVAITDHNSHVRAIKTLFMLFCRYRMFTIWLYKIFDTKAEVIKARRQKRNGCIHVPALAELWRKGKSCAEKLQNGKDCSIVLPSCWSWKVLWHLLGTSL